MKALLALLFVLVAAPLFAQTPIVIGPNTVFQWDVIALTVAEAQSLTYAVTVDAVLPVVVLPVPTCVTGVLPLPAGTQTCNVPILSIPLGAHSVTMTAASGGLISLPSASFAYMDLVIPIPSGLRFK